MVWLVRFSDRLRRHLQRLEEWESSKGRANWKSSVHEIRKAKETWRSKVYHGIMFISCWGNRWLLSGSTSFDCTCIAFDHGPVLLEKLSAKEALKTDRHSLIALLAFHQSTSCESLWPDMNGYGTTDFFRCTFGPISLKTHCSIKVLLLVRHCHERRKLRQELPSRIEEAKRSGVRPFSLMWKDGLGKLQLPFSVLDVCVCDITINYTSGMQHSLWTESPRFFRNEVIRSWKLQRKDCGNQGRRQPCGTPNQPNLVQNRPMRQVRLEAALTNPSDLKDICFSAVKDKRINL